MLRSADNTVGKYIHEDGSETTIKSVDTCVTIRSSEGVSFRHENRNKYSVFLSGSSGCFMNCKFCHLTANHAKYKRLSPGSVEQNVMAAVRSEATFQPDLHQRYAKLCWMGMGDEQLMRPWDTHDITLNLAHNLIEDKLFAQGLDGCDIATCLPRVRDAGWINALVLLNGHLRSFERNPLLLSQPDRSPLRLFWSLQSGIQDTRDMLIPNAMPLKEAAAQLRLFKQSGINIIIHQLFFDGVNDHPDEINALLNFLYSECLSDAELRVLRYNAHPNSTLRESRRFDEIINDLSFSVRKFKVQESKGHEVSAACGQFLKGAA